MENALKIQSYELCPGIRDKKKELEDARNQYLKASAEKDENGKRAAILSHQTLVAKI